MGFGETCLTSQCSKMLGYISMVWVTGGLVTLHPGKRTWIRTERLQISTHQVAGLQGMRGTRQQ